MLIIYKLTELESLVIKRYGNACYEAALDRLEQINGVRDDEVTLYGISHNKTGYVLSLQKLGEEHTETVETSNQSESPENRKFVTSRKALVRIGTYQNGFETIEVLADYEA